MSKTVKQQMLLDELLDRLRDAVADNLDSAVLYGSAASGEFHPEFSDLNVLCILNRLDEETLRRIAPVTKWWLGKKQPAPVLFTLHELRNAADVFAIELSDIQSRHRVLYGPDHFQSLVVPLNLHRIQVERELRINLIKLRQNYLAAANDSKTALRLMTDSVSTFGTLFRHALLAMGEPPPEHRVEAAKRLAQVLGFDDSAFQKIMDVRKGITALDKKEIAGTFANYLQAIERVTEEVDRRLA